MKRRILPLLGIVIACLVLIACTKSNLKASFPPPSPQPPILNLVAGDWQQDSSGVFICTLSTVLDYAPYITLRVYINEWNNFQYIDQAGLEYMNGTLSYIISGSNLVLKYESFDPILVLPFSELPVQVVFEP